MSPQVTAAIIAASISFLTLIGTLAAQYFGRRATSKQLDRTFAEQVTRTLNERFATAAEQLGSDKPAVRLAGVHAMAGLADDWEENRQTCIDVLCAYLRIPYEPDPGEGAPIPERIAFRAIREVRHTVIRVIAAHLRYDAKVSWQGFDFDFTGVVFDGGDFSHAHFSGGDVTFMEAEFTGDGVNFLDTIFEAEQFSTGGFSGAASFVRARFTGGMSTFARAKFSSLVLFGGAEFSGGDVFFGHMKFSGGEVSFADAKFSGANVQFEETEFSGACTEFYGAEFSRGQVDFRRAKFSGGKVNFDRAEFSGGEVDFSNPGDWSVPPQFPWTDAPPPGVKLPKKEDQSQG
jgi:uncharacterized protein YjbI with pentapeptide repeats